jgi:hypothetical protein
MASTHSLSFRLISGASAMAPLLIVFAMLIVIFGGVRSEHVPIVSIGLAVGALGLVMYTLILGYFLYAVHREERFDSADRARWTYILLLWFPFGAIAYWYKYIWSTADTPRP